MKFHNKNFKKGFGIAEILVSILVLGLMYMSVLKLIGSNHEGFIRIRGRDGGVDVAQEVMDKIKARGIASLPTMTDSAWWGDDSLTRSWERNIGGQTTLNYKAYITVEDESTYVAKAPSNFDTLTHAYAKQVTVKVEWPFKGGTQSVTLSGVVR